MSAEESPQSNEAVDLTGLSGTGNPSEGGDAAGEATATQPVVQPGTVDEGTIVEAPESMRSVGDQIVQQMKTVFDPEIPVDIYELGLIYNVKIEDDGAVAIRMTLTSPMCPAAEELPSEVETKSREVEGVTSVTLDLVWDPPWNPGLMSEAARLELGMY